MFYSFFLDRDYLLINLLQTLSIEGGEEEKWRVKHEHRSPNYLTELDNILTVEIDT